ncbi:MAG: glycosyltransferase [Propionibacteriales bacterium]|nr:glycosyltransferase [Propionibacteriales bacterium]
MSAPKERLRRLAGRLRPGSSPAADDQQTRQAMAQQRTASALVDEIAAAAVAPRPARPEVTAAVATGERLATGLAWEWTQLALDPADWHATLTESSVDLLLVEVAGPKVPGWEADQLVALVDWCTGSDLPVVVWVTAGPAPRSAERSVGALATVASHVYVADPTLLPAWQDLAGDKAVAELAPAAAPRVHSPVAGGPGERRTRGACLVLDAGGPHAAFAGQLATVVAAAVKPMPAADVAVWQVEGEPVNTAAIPGTLQTRLVGTYGYPTVAGAIGRYHALVDAGRRDPSASWSVLEAGAAQTSVVSLPDQIAALPAEIAEHVGGAADQRALRSEIVARIRQPELRDREALRLQRAVLDGHTYGHRVDRILAGLGREPVPVRRSVSAVVPTNRDHEIDNILANIGRQAHTDTELVLVLHGLALDQADLQARAKDTGVQSLTVVEADSTLTLGACMNAGVDASSGAYVAKMDDDNFYGRHYLTDLVRAFDYTEAGIVGKWAHYVWLRSTDAVVLRYFASEHTYERRIQGGSMLFDGDVVRRLRFGDLPRAVDSDILDRAIAEGVRIYSSDRFNFVSIRGTDRHAHTWTVTDSTFMTATGRLAFYGDPRTHVEV